jgi:hypothetical protein
MKKFQFGLLELFSNSIEANQLFQCNVQQNIYFARLSLETGVTFFLSETQEKVIAKILQLILHMQPIITFYLW